MAIDEVNKAGGLLGKNVRVIVEDDQGKPEEAQTVVTKLITRDQVIAILARLRRPARWRQLPWPSRIAFP